MPVTLPSLPMLYDVSVDAGGHGRTASAMSRVDVDQAAGRDAGGVEAVALHPVAVRG